MKERIIAEAETWLRTPFHHEARVKGAGVDCGMFIWEVFKAVGLPTPESVPHYSRDFMLHRDQEWYVRIILQFCDELQGEPEPGDIALFLHGRLYSHGAIVVSWPRIIHASAADKCVAWGDASMTPLAGKPVRFFRHRAMGGDL